MDRSSCLALCALLVAGCHDGVSLSAPKAMLADVLFVELDDIHAEGDALAVGGSVTNLTPRTIWLDPAQWRLDLGTLRVAPTGTPVVYEIPRHRVAYVELAFNALPPDAMPADAMLVIGGVRGEDGDIPAVLGAIPLSVARLPEGVMSAQHELRPARGEEQPEGEELLERDCGSGPLVTCPR